MLSAIAQEDEVTVDWRPAVAHAMRMFEVDALIASISDYIRTDVLASPVPAGDVQTLLETCLAVLGCLRLPQFGGPSPLLSASACALLQQLDQAAIRAGLQPLDAARGRWAAGQGDDDEEDEERRGQDGSYSAHYSNNNSTTATLPSSSTRATTTPAVYYHRTLQFAHLSLSLLSLQSLCELCLRLAAPFDAHFHFWRVRLDWAASRGPGLAMVRELVEGGPIEWAQRLQALYVASRRGNSSSGGGGGDSGNGVMMEPADKVARLSVLRTPILRIIGHCKRGMLAFKETTGVPGALAWQSEAVLFLRSVLNIKAHTAAAASGAQHPAPGPDAPLSAHDFIAIMGGLRSLAAKVEQRIAPLRGRTPARLAWAAWTATAAVGAVSIVYAIRNREHMRQVLVQAVASAHAFYVEHLEEPVRVIVHELFGRRTDEVDPDSLSDAHNSLVAMLRNFNERLETNAMLRKSLSPELQRADLQEMARQADMRTVSERFVIEVQHPLINGVGGDLVEMMLIQIAFIKREVLTSMAKMDQILRENQFNFQVSAMIPAFLVAYFGSSTMVSAFRLATAPVDTSGTRQSLKWALRDLHRLLSIAQLRVQATTMTLHYESRSPQTREHLRQKCSNLTSVIWNENAWSASVAEAYPSLGVQGQGGIALAAVEPPAVERAVSVLYRALAIPVNVVRNLIAISRLISMQHRVVREEAGPPTPTGSGVIAHTSRYEGAHLTASSPPASVASSNVSREQRQKQEDYLSVLEMSVHPNPAFRPDHIRTHVVTTSAPLHPAPTPTLTPHRTAEAVDNHNDTLFSSCTAYPGLSSEQLGHLVVLLRRVRNLLDDLRTSMNFPEWIRIRQDLQDCLAGSSSPTVLSCSHISAGSVEALAAVDRLTSYYGLLDDRNRQSVFSTFTGAA